MEVGDEVVDFTGLDAELKRSGDSSAFGRKGKKSHKIGQNSTIQDEIL